jgi:hypothetical protein
VIDAILRALQSSRWTTGLDISTMGHTNQQAAQDSILALVNRPAYSTNKLFFFTEQHDQKYGTIHWSCCTTRLRK